MSLSATRHTTGKKAPVGSPATVAAAAAKRRGTNLTMDVEIIDAVTAREWLELTDRQRHIRKPRVVAIARDIVEGNWTLTGEAFKFDADGRFVDGQHRAHAVIMADKERPGISIEAVVIRGVPAAAMTVMDTGAARSAGDQLNIASFDNPTLLAAAAKWILLFDRDVLYGDRLIRTATHAEIRKFVDLNPELLPIVSTTATRLRRHVDAMTPASLAAAYYICWRIHPEQAHWFFDKLATGVSLDEGSPILALRSRLRELQHHHSTLRGEAYLSLAIRTWNAVRENREMGAIPVFRRGLPVRCPPPV